MNLRSSLAALVLVIAFLATVPARAIVVFDPTNFVENALTAINTLDQVNNQIKQLQNEATMLINQAKHLTNLPFNILARLQSTLALTDQLVSQARGLTFQLAPARANFARLHPDLYHSWTTGASMAADAQERWTNSLRALETTIDLQSQAAQNMASDESSLADLVSQSQGAIGALQAVQATNQLLALQARQVVQDQQLRLTQERSATLERARIVAEEARAREVRRRFQGAGVAYTPQPVDFYGF